MFKKKQVVILALVILAVLGLYVCFNPANSYLAPKCAFKTLTGYDCPSCGGQRMVHAMLNGKFREAFFLNPFLFIAIPYLGAVAYSAFSHSKLAVRIKTIVQHRITIGFYLLLYLAWWVVRNTSIWQTL